jgi:hypothetical protein
MPNGVDGADVDVRQIRRAPCSRRKLHYGDPEVL